MPFPVPVNPFVFPRIQGENGLSNRAGTPVKGQTAPTVWPAFGLSVDLVDLAAKLAPSAFGVFAHRPAAFSGGLIRPLAGLAFRVPFVALAGPTLRHI